MKMASESPILALEHNIIHAFENARPGFTAQLLTAIETKQVLPEISLRLDLTLPKGPRVTKVAEGHPAEIRLHVTHLEMLWGFIYAWTALYEEGIQKPNMEAIRGESFPSDSSLLARAQSLLNWACAMSGTYAPWPPELPSPLKSDEDAHAARTNSIFQQATAFLIAHEWVHVTSQHVRLQPGVAGPSDVDAIEYEKDADNTAFDTLVDPQSDDDEKLLSAWAVLSVLLSSYYLVRDRSRLKQHRHPELHHRIQHLLERLHFEGELPRAYFHGLCIEALRHTFSEAPWQDPDGGYETAEECLQSTFDQLDEMLANETLPLPCRSPRHLQPVTRMAPP
jgi:hypothetical protein